MDPKDLLLKDLEIFEEALGRNEEIGEKRFSFFVTLVTAVAGGLVAFYTRDNAPTWNPDERQPLIVGACMVLFLIGLLSYFRMLHRNRVTDGYKKTTKFIREKYKAQLENRLEGYSVPRRLSATGGFEKVREKYLRGGYAETMAVMDGMILGVLVWASNPSLIWTPITAGLIVWFPLWWI